MAAVQNAVFNAFDEVGQENDIVTNAEDRDFLYTQEWLANYVVTLEKELGVHSLHDPLDVDTDDLQ